MGCRFPGVCVWSRLLLPPARFDVLLFQTLRGPNAAVEIARQASHGYSTTTRNERRCSQRVDGKQWNGGGSVRCLQRRRWWRCDHQSGVRERVQEKETQSFSRESPALLSSISKPLPRLIGGPLCFKTHLAAARPKKAQRCGSRSKATGPGRHSLLLEQMLARLCHRVSPCRTSSLTNFFVRRTALFAASNCKCGA